MRIITLITILLAGLISCCPLLAQVNADFTSNVNTGCNSLQVSFTDLSTSMDGTIESWSWDLAGAISTSQNPGRIFGTPGSYTICLTVTDSEGNIDTECKTDFIQVYSLPQPAFSTDNLFGCAPTEVTFFNQSLSTDGEIEEWVWGLGGSTGVLIDSTGSQVISSVYDNPDSYTISLTVTDENGCVNTITEENYLTIFEFPEIDISISDTFNCTSPLLVNFTNNNPDPNVNYFWNFGNGNPTFQGASPPSIAYLNEGSFTVSVIAENSLTSCIDTLVLENVINIGNAVEFTNAPNSACDGSTINFTNTSDPEVTDWQWDFGDGTMSTEQSPSHTYNTPGCYFVTLSGTINGCVDTYTNTTCIEIFELPAVSFITSNSDGCELPHTVGFVAVANTAVAFSWDFGDGGTSDFPNTSHTYEDFGIYPVTLEVTDINGCMNSFTDTVQVVALEAQMNLSTVFGCSPVTFDLSESSTSVSPISSWEWTVDTSFADFNSPLFNSNSSAPSFTIADTGWYDVRLIVTNTLGCIDTIINRRAVGVGIVPQVDFSAIPLVVCVNEAIQFTDLSSSYADAWSWDFGDGNFSVEQNPVHSYNRPDTFDISLTIAHNGCFNFLDIPDYIIVEEPRAVFEIERDCIDPYRISLINNATGADSVFWDFGFNETTDTSTALNPVVNYPGTGCYTIVQTVFNFTTGCVDSMEQNFCITDPAASFSLSPQSGCSPLVVQVENNSVFDVAWSWSAPGGNISNPNIKSPTITYSTPGFYSDIQLIITDANNCSDTIMFQGEIDVDGVTVDFESSPAGGCSPLQVDFIDNSSSFITPITDWSWNIDNSALITTDQNTSFFFDTIGTYPVSLTVTNERGCQTTLNVNEAVNVTLPMPLFTADTISCPADTVAFTNISTTQIGTLDSFWDFGDGETSTESNPRHQFLTPGNFEVCLTVTDFTSCEQTYCRFIDIVLPQAAFTADTTYANCPPLVVNFENQSQNSFLYEWDFGDNSGISNLENPPHAYTVPGSYDVQLVVSINANCTDTLMLEDYIELEGPVGDFFFDKDTACIPDRITFIGASEGAFTYIWDFGDGTLDTTFNVMNDTITHAYQEIGSFVPMLILVDSENCQRTLASPTAITIGILDIDFTASDSTLCEGIDQAQFINLVNSSETITDLQWLFENGDPLTSTAFEPSVVFPNMGVYDVSLIVENTFCRDTLTKEDFIGAGALPTADFSSSINTGCIPLGVQFTDMSTSVDGAISSWDWSFGRTENSDETNPFHIFTIGDTVDVILEVTTEFNCSDTASTQMILFAPATTLLSSSETDICIGDVVQLNAMIETETIGVTYEWLADPSLSCLDCFDPLADPTTTTTYFFVTNTPNNCADTSRITVVVSPFTIPDIMLTADTTLCIMESLQLNVSSSGTVTYDWNQDADSLSCLDCNNPLASPTESSTYFVTVTNSFGCDAVDSVSIEVIDQTDLNLGDDRTICEGDTVTLDLLVDGTAFWLNGNGLSCTDCSDPLATPRETTVYPVQLITSDFSCQLLDTITVNVYNADDVDAGQDQQICIGETIILDAMTNSPGSIIWSPATGLDQDTILNPLASPTDTVMYVITVAEDQCILMDSVEITVQYITEVESFDYEICLGDTVELSFVGEADNISWSPVESLSDPMAENPLAFPTETTNYVLNAQLSTCAEDSTIARVVVNQPPGVVLPARYDKFPEDDIQITLEIVSGSGDYTIDWLRYDGLSCNNCALPVLSIDTFGYYPVVVTDEFNGCTTEQRVFINLLRRCSPDLIFVPNIFTPNNDGQNDKLTISSGVIEEISVFRVYNRWGALVYETNDINESWNGMYKGDLMPSGVYVYYLEARCTIDDSVLLKKGDFTLVR